MSGVRVTKVKGGEEVDLGERLASSKSGKTLLVLGTYAADFNAIEYGQRVKHYLPALKEKGVEDVCVVFNANPASCDALASILDLPEEVEILSDPMGAAGKAFDVGRGWLPDDDSISPYAKLFGMLVGLGAPMTLPYVIAGYIGNPGGKAGWIETSLAVGQRKGRWPDMALDLDGATGKVASNSFNDLPIVGGWGRRPLELATLRLQNMMGISIANWGELAPDEEQLKAGVLTQLGGCVVIEGSTGEAAFEWKDPGICAVASFDDMLAAI